MCDVPLGSVAAAVAPLVSVTTPTLASARSTVVGPLGDEWPGSVAEHGWTIPFHTSSTLSVLTTLGASNVNGWPIVVVVVFAPSNSSPTAGTASGCVSGRDSGSMSVRVMLTIGAV